MAVSVGESGERLMTVGRSRRTVMAVRMDVQGLTRSGRRNGRLVKDWGKGLGLGGEGQGLGGKTGPGWGRTAVQGNYGTNGLKPLVVNG